MDIHRYVSKLFFVYHPCTLNQTSPLNPTNLTNVVRTTLKVCAGFCVEPPVKHVPPRQHGSASAGRNVADPRVDAFQ